MDCQIKHVTSRSSVECWLAVPQETRNPNRLVGILSGLVAGFTFFPIRWWSQWRTSWFERPQEAFCWHQRQRKARELVHRNWHRHRECGFNAKDFWDLESLGPSSQWEGVQDIFSFDTLGCPVFSIMFFSWPAPFFGQYTNRVSNIGAERTCQPTSK